MSYLKNEKGNAAIFMLWLLGIVAVIFVLTINIVKVYVVKEHANLAVEQAALAGTAVLLEKTQEAVEEFDTSPNPLYDADRLLQRVSDGGKSIGDLIDEKKLQYISSGMDESNAYIKAANGILPSRVDSYYFLEKELRDKLGDSQSNTYYIISSAIFDVIDENKGRTEDTNIELSNKDWRVEVESSVRFVSISDHKFISQFISDIPQKGYGPTLAYLENVYD